MSGTVAAILIGTCVLAILVLGGLIFIKVMRQNRAEARVASLAGRWELAAHSIGMALDPSAPNSLDPRMMRGRLRDVDVTAIWQRRVAGSEFDHDAEVEVSAAISPPMRLGLQIFRTGSRWQESIESRFGAQDIEVGIPALDHPFIIRGFSNEAVAGVLGGPQARPFVEALCRPVSGIDLIVNDREVQMVASSFVADPQRLYYLVDLAAYLASAVAEARAWFPLERWESDIGAAWQRVAGTLGLKFDQGRLSLVGELGGMRVSVWLDHHEGNWCTAIQVSFSRPLREHIQLFADGELLTLRPLAGLKDVNLSDFEFDQAFVVQGLQQETTQRILPPAIRQSLMEQRRNAVDVSLQTHRLVVHANRVLSDVGILEGRINEVVSLAGQISSA